jgi:hypothetical protein
VSSRLLCPLTLAICFPHYSNRDVDQFKHYFLINFSVMLTGRERFMDILFLMDTHEEYKRKQREVQRGHAMGEMTPGRRMPI